GQPSKCAQLLLLSFAAHILSSFAQIWITRNIYGGGDLLAYYRHGSLLAQLLSFDFARFAPELLSLFLQGDPRLPAQSMAGSTTGSMFAISSFALFFLGHSLHGLCAAIAIVSFYGKLALYRALCKDAEPQKSQGLLIAVMLIPTVVFWSSGLLKESIIIGP